MFRHEVYRIRRGLLGRDDQIALILAILAVREDEHAPVAAAFMMFSTGEMWKG